MTESNSPSFEYGWSLGPKGVEVWRGGDRWQIPWADLPTVIAGPMLYATSSPSAGQPITLHQAHGGGWAVTIGPIDAVHLYRFGAGELESLIAERVTPADGREVYQVAADVGRDTSAESDADGPELVNALGKLLMAGDAQNVASFFAEFEPRQYRPIAQKLVDTCARRLPHGAQLLSALGIPEEPVTIGDRLARAIVAGDVERFVEAVEAERANGFVELGRELVAGAQRLAFARGLFTHVSEAAA